MWDEVVNDEQWMSNELDRPAVLTEATQRLIVESLAEGNYLSTACLTAGTTVDTFYYWKRLCESGTEHAQAYADFFGAVKAASAKAESDSLKLIRRGVSGWQGAAWFLERRFREKWGRKEVVVLKAPEKDLSKMTDDELAEYRKQLRKRSRG